MDYINEIYVILVVMFQLLEFIVQLRLLELSRVVSASIAVAVFTLKMVTAVFAETYE
jgi:hypothetical protein